MLQWAAVISALAVLILILVGIIIGWRRSRLRNLDARHQWLAERTGRLNPARSRTLLKDLYALAHAGIAAGNAAIAYRTIELIQTVYSEGFARDAEPHYLSALIVSALRAKQPETAAVALDAGRQLLRNLPASQTPMAVEQLTYVAAVALRGKVNFLAAKATEIISTVLERDWQENSVAVSAALRALKTLGALVLRRRDEDLFREMIITMIRLIPERPGGTTAAELAALTTAWLHRIVYRDDPALFDILREFVAGLMQQGFFDTACLVEWLKDWQNLGGTASLKRTSALAPLIVGFTLRTALDSERLQLWAAAVDATGLTVRLAVERYGLKAAFVLLEPLLEMGRELLAVELTVGFAEDANSFRQRALYATVCECVSLAEYAARQDMITTAGDIIADIHQLWSDRPRRANSKSAKRFCQLLAVYWLKIRTKRAKRATVSEKLTQPVLLSEADQQRLWFLL